MLPSNGCVVGGRRRFLGGEGRRPRTCGPRVEPLAGAKRWSADRMGRSPIRRIFRRRSRRKITATKPGGTGGGAPVKTACPWNRTTISWVSAKRPAVGRNRHGDGCEKRRVLPPGFEPGWRGSRPRSLPLADGRGGWGKAPAQESSPTRIRTWIAWTRVRSSAVELPVRAWGDVSESNRHFQGHSLIGCHYINASMGIGWEHVSGEWSERRDLDPRPPGPEPGALPG